VAGAVYYFCEQDMPVAKRHSLETWARTEHGIEVEIIDGAALAEQLAQRSLYWIAERFLALPADLRPTRTASLQSEAEQLLARPSQIRLPAWPRGWDESNYNAYASDLNPQFLLLDRVLFGVPGTHGRFQACDLLGPGDELIHVRRATDSASFGHLFNQALISTQILAESAEARTALAESVKERGNGRSLDLTLGQEKL
jgi:hypothetical protein